METTILLWLLFGFISAIVGAKKGEGCLGFIFGVLLGPIGLLIVIASSGNRKICPYCKSKVHKDALVCPHCQRDLKSNISVIGISNIPEYKESTSHSWFWSLLGKEYGRLQVYLRKKE